MRCKAKIASKAQRTRQYVSISKRFSTPQRAATGPVQASTEAKARYRHRAEQRVLVIDAGGGIVARRSHRHVQRQQMLLARVRDPRSRRLAPTREPRAPLGRRGRQRLAEPGVELPR